MLQVGKSCMADLSGYSITLTQIGKKIRLINSALPRPITGTPRQIKQEIDGMLESKRITESEWRKIMTAYQVVTEKAKI